MKNGEASRGYRRDDSAIVIHHDDDLIAFGELANDLHLGDACGSAVLWRRVWSTAMLGLGCGLTVLLVNRRVTDGAQSSIE